MKTITALKNIGLAIVFCGIAIPVALRFDSPSSAFLLAAMSTALFAGRIAGLFAAVLLALCFDVLFLQPTHQLAIAHGSLVRFISFVTAMLFATELISAKRHSDEARVQRERDFRLLTETCPDCILIVDKDRIIRFANPSLTRLFGYSAPDVEGKPASFLLTDLKTDQQPHGEFLARTSKDTFVPVEATCGNFDRKMTIFLRDISDRKKAQEKMEGSERELRLILDTIPGMVYTRNPDGRVEYVNGLAMNYFGTTSKEIGKGEWVNALHPDEREWVLSAIEKNFAKGEPYSMEYRRRRFDGEYRWFETKVQPLRTATGEVLRWYGLLTDIHDRKAAEESLRQIQNRLSHAAQLAMASEMSAAIVHEISQPLAAMVANGQAGLRWLLANPPNIENGMMSIERVVRDGKDAREIVKGLRTLFKRSAPEKSPFDLRQVVDEVVLLTRGRTERHGISLKVDIVPNLPMVFADRIQVQQVLLNLVSNAIDALQDICERTRLIVIRIEERDGSVATDVVDTGAGVENLDKIFETFFTTKEDGMGMGLSICKSIIEAHSGRLQAVRNTPYGMSFSFTLPAFTGPAITAKL